MAQPTDKELEDRIQYSVDDGANYGDRPKDMNTVTHVRVFCARLGSHIKAKIGDVPKPKRGRRVTEKVKRQSVGTEKLQDQPLNGGLKPTE